MDDKDERIHDQVYMTKEYKTKNILQRIDTWHDIWYMIKNEDDKEYSL